MYFTLDVHFFTGTAKYLCCLKPHSRNALSLGLLFQAAHDSLAHIANIVSHIVCHVIRSAVGFERRAAGGLLGLPARAGLGQASPFIVLWSGPGLPAGCSPRFSRHAGLLNYG